ncbi:hypothetical protein LJK88_44990 [Paenibacillus sp. P26]|nr:hypothetical protein LJK88_44990 [Paenibacillus sp. P26]
MNSQFLIWFLVLFLLLLALDLRQWRRIRKGEKGLYLAIYAVTLGFFVCAVFRYSPPMPTQFFIHKVSPWVFSVVHPEEINDKEAGGS